MPDERPDPAIERIADALRPLPGVDESAKARVLVAIAGERLRGQERAARRLTWRAGGGVATAAALVVAVALATRASDRKKAPVGAVQMPAAPAASPAVLAADAGATASVPVQLVLRAPLAHHVAVVGDFTGWDDARVAMTRDPASGLWIATVHVRPGRHVYAYVADDTLWLRDPHAPVATDPDFGRPGSLLLVGKP